MVMIDDQTCSLSQLWFVGCTAQSSLEYLESRWWHSQDCRIRFFCGRRVKTDCGGHLVRVRERIRGEQAGEEVEAGGDEMGGRGEKRHPRWRCSTAPLVKIRLSLMIWFKRTEKMLGFFFREDGWPMRQRPSSLKKNPYIFSVHLNYIIWLNLNLNKWCGATPPSGMALSYLILSKIHFKRYLGNLLFFLIFWMFLLFSSHFIHFSYE